MKFVFIDPFNSKVEMIDVPTIENAYAHAGLDVHSKYGVDHGLLTRHISIALDGYGLLLPSHLQRYFQIGRNLYGGKAILYGIDIAGETVDMPEKPMVVFFPNANEVERAIQSGQIERPIILVNGETIWEWKA